MLPREIFSYLVTRIHSTVVATVDNQGQPVTCAIDMMDWDDASLYFLTAKGKAFYERLKKQAYLALTGMNGTDTLSCTAISLRGRVRELGPALLPRLFEKNPYMETIYPTKLSRAALTVFQLYEGTGEWFDLSKQPIERQSFAFGGAKEPGQGYFVTSACTGCGNCAERCPQACIDVRTVPAVIQEEHCLRCGNCFAVCPARAIRKGEEP